MEDVTDNRLARGARERMVNCGNCSHWNEMVCGLDGEDIAETDCCGKWEGV